MSDVMKAAPLPWTSTEETISDSAGVRFLEIETLRGTFRDDAALAAEVVRRVNAHEALVSALVKAELALRSYNIGDGSALAAERRAQAIDASRAALKAAKGES